MAGARLEGLALTLAGALGIMISGWTWIGSNIKAGEGMQTGKVVQFERYGTVWETYEGVVALDESGCELMRFSLDRSRKNNEHLEKLIVLLEECAEQQKTVKLKYVKYYAVAPWRGETNTYVVEAEQLK